MISVGIVGGAACIAVAFLRLVTRRSCEMISAIALRDDAEAVVSALFPRLSMRVNRQSHQGRRRATILEHGHHVRLAGS